MATENEKIKWFRDRLLVWAEDHLRDYPWRKTNNPYDILIAEFLLQRTDADTVVSIYEIFLARYPTINELAIAPVEDLAEILQPLGLFFKAERLSKTAQIIMEKHKGKVPQEKTELLKLSGIGKYTARAILSQAFDRPAAVLDTNVARVLERFFGIEGGRVKSRCKILWSAADNISPNINVRHWNLTLLDFGALTCTARNPKCLQCPLSSRCYWLNSIKLMS
jgi:A/G-specific adenine glycosylase